VVSSSPLRMASLAYRAGLAWAAWTCALHLEDAKVETRSRLVVDLARQLWEVAIVCDPLPFLESKRKCI
jgi:hypothetical protein